MDDCHEIQCFWFLVSSGDNMTDDETCGVEQSLVRRHVPFWQDHEMKSEIFLRYLYSME